MPAATLSASGGDGGIKMPAKLRSLYQAQKPEITIALHNKRPTYTTLDRLEGIASVVAPIDVRFDNLEIEFVGTTRTYVERVTSAAAVSGRSEAFHQFLKLSQPRLEEHFPADGILKAGRTYQFPFLFVVPQQLLPKICQHKIVSPSVRDEHVQLPPSFGDKEVSLKTSSGSAIDDMVPDMASIRYGIFVRITKNKEQNDEVVKTTVASHAKRLRIIPATSEQPPLDISGEDHEYVSRKEKTIRKGVLKGKLGTLVMEATQPSALHVPARKSSSDNSSESLASSSTTVATVMLRFDPADASAPPPRLGSLASKLKVCTFFASTARADFPRRSPTAAVDLSQGIHTEQVALSSRCMANAEWTKRDPTRPETFPRRDSAFSIASSSADACIIPDPSPSYRSGTLYYTARLFVPVALPTNSNKFFAPTFNSCLVSRNYILKLDLGLQTLGTTMDLRLPLQISCDGPPADELQSSRQNSIVDDAAMETEVGGGSGGSGNGDVPSQEEIAAADEFFAPRVIRMPGEELLGRSRLGSFAPPINDAPPEYAFFATDAPRRSVGAAGVPVF